MPVRNLLIIMLSAIVSMACYAKAQRNRFAATITEAMHIISSQFIEEVEPRQLFESAMDGMVESLDQYSGFISPDDFTQFQESLDQKFGGIGIIVELNPETKRLTVMSPLVDTPAHRAGMRAGDTILSIDGNSTVDMTLKDAVGLMRGPPGTPIKVAIRHAGDMDRIELTLNREIIPVESVLGDTRQPNGAWNFYLEDHPEIAYIRITSFGEKTAAELRKALQFGDRPTKALIIDLRNNAGGLLTAAVKTCDTFLSSGKIVSTRGRGGKVRRVHEANERGTVVPRDLPMVILANKYSASASEIVAACLQDHGRAVVVGERTWGKGTVQNIIQLEGGKSALKLTTATYWRPSGKNIHRFKKAGEEDDWGVSPNEGFEVKLTDEEFQRVARYRRQRDVVRAQDDPPEDPEEPKGTNSENGAPPELHSDPQLRKAIEYLKERIRRSKEGPQKA